MTATLWMFIAGCGSDGPTRGSQCQQVLTAACNRMAKDCQQFAVSEIAGCIQTGTTVCCAGTCGASVISTQAEIDTCSMAIAVASCATLDLQNGGTLPASCLGVVRSALTSGATSALTLPPASNSERIGRLLSR